MNEEKPFIICFDEESKTVINCGNFKAGLFFIDDLHKLASYVANTIKLYSFKGISNELITLKREKEMEEFITNCQAQPQFKKQIEDHLYLIHDTILNTLKIGRSNNPKARLRSLQTATANKLELLHIVEKAGFMESKIHLEFEDYRLASEWFFYEETIVNYIKTIKIYF